MNIKELQEKIQKLELVNTKAKEKINKLQKNSRRITENPQRTITEDEELALALEQIKEIETRNSVINSNNHTFRNNRNRDNHFGFNIDPTDIININSPSSNRRKI